MQNKDELQTFNEPSRPDFEQPEIEPTAVSPNDPPWNILTGLGFWLTSVLFILILPLFFVLPYAGGQNFNLADSKALAEFLQTDKTAILLNIAAVIPAHLLTIALAYFIITRNRRYPFFETLGWQWGGFKFWHGALILVGFFALSLIVSHFLPDQENELLKVLRSSREATILVALVATFSAPLVEEVVYRGVLYSAAHKTFGQNAAIVLVTFLFTLVHVPQYLPSYSTILLLFLLSLILTIIRARTENLLPCVALHFVFNGIQSTVLVLEPYLRVPENPAPNLFIQSVSKIF